MSVLDCATKEEAFKFQCDRSTSKVALAIIQSEEFMDSFKQFIEYVMDSLEHLILESGEGEGEFTVPWHEYEDLFPLKLPAIDDQDIIADLKIHDWIEKTILPQANLILQYIKVSISVDGMGFSDSSYWRSEKLCFVLDSVRDERQSQEA